jgi:hypothetical protein
MAANWAVQMAVWSDADSAEMSAVCWVDWMAGYLAEMLVVSTVARKAVSTVDEKAAQTVLKSAALMAPLMDGP